MSDENENKTPKQAPPPQPASATGQQPADASAQGTKQADPGLQAAPSNKEPDAKGQTQEPAKDEKAAGEEEKKRPAQPSAQELLAEDLGELKIRKAKGSKNVHSGVVHILATFNNTKVTFTDPAGNVISWSSSGKCNFRGSRKSTAFAAQIVTQDAGKVAMSHGMKEVAVRVRGPGMGRDSAVRALQSLGLIVTSITDVTPIPHNGCRPPKRRRV